MLLSFFCDQQVELRDDCLFCWYWQNCWLSLLKRFFSYHLRDILALYSVVQDNPHTVSYGLPFQTSLHYYNHLNYLKCSNMFNCIFVVLAHWNNSLWIDMSSHEDTLIWFSQPVHLKKKLYAQQRSSKYQCQSLVWPELGSNPLSTALQARPLTIKRLMQFSIYMCGDSVNTVNW